MAVYRLNEAIEKAIYDWAVAASGLTVVWDKPGKASPALPYVTLNLMAPRSTGPAEERYNSLDTFEYPMRKAITLSVNVYAENGHLKIMNDIINSLELDTKLVILKAAGIAVWTIGQPIDLSEIMETSAEFRVAVDIVLAYTEMVTDVVGEIEKVRVEKTPPTPTFVEDIET